jgi:hypothetical protein
MNKSEHHAKAEQLLEEAARTGPDQISRSQLLAEAQVHAILALSAPAEESPPGTGQPETISSAATRGADPGSSESGGGVDPRPYQDLTFGEASVAHLPEPATESPARTPGGPPGSALFRPAAAQGMQPPANVPEPPMDEDSLVRPSTRPAQTATTAQPATMRLPAGPDPTEPRRRRRAGQPGELEPGDPGAEEPDDPADQGPRGAPTPF